MVLRWFRSSTGKSALPRPTGPFTVGFVDYEWRPTKTAHTQSPPSYILARIYYPSLPVTKHEESEEMEPEWRGRSHWIPSPAYFPGYGYYLKMPWYVASPLFRLMAGNTPIWAVENAPPTPSSWLPRLPLIIFSHGLAGIRTTYATICTDLASQGYIVAAIEHRDGSASMSVMPENAAILQYQHPPPDDTAAFEFRAEQLKHRRQEVSATIDLVTGVCEYGDPTSEARKNIWTQRSGRELAERTDLVDDPLAALQDRIITDRVGMVGHSFGAATSILSSQQDPRLAGVIALDPWMFPFPTDFSAIHQARGVPMMVINSSTFHWPTNLQSLRQVLERNRHLNADAPSLQLTITNTRHMDQSDFSVLVPRWLATQMKSPPLSDPLVTLGLNTQLVSAFMQGLFASPSQKVSGDREASFTEEHQFREMIWSPTVQSSPNERVLLDFKL